jgi:S-formylglutathione hydrolase FrmB
MKLRFFLLLFFCAFANTQAATIDTLYVKSKAMHKEIPNIVITPNGYNTSKTNYPVLYLLHGATDYFTAWTSKAKGIQDLVDQYNIIVVCPDGGYTSWYFDSPIDPKMQYETYISKELIKKIDKKYQTRANKKGRAIAGLSMGGHGAFYLAFKHQDIWGAAGSMSGGVDIRPFPNNWDISKRLGSYADNKELWEENTVTNLVHLLKPNSLKLVFECGTDDFFYNVNKTLHQKLLDNNIPHDYSERPGKHNWNYWTNAIKYQMLFFNDFFNTSK